MPTDLKIASTEMEAKKKTMIKQDREWLRENEKKRVHQRGKSVKTLFIFYRRCW